MQPSHHSPLTLFLQIWSQGKFLHLLSRRVETWANSINHNSWCFILGSFHASCVGVTVIGWMPEMNQSSTQDSGNSFGFGFGFGWTIWNFLGKVCVRQWLLVVKKNLSESWQVLQSRGMERNGKDGKLEMIFGKASKMKCQLRAF